MDDASTSFDVDANAMDMSVDKHTDDRPVDEAQSMPTNGNTNTRETITITSLPTEVLDLICGHTFGQKEICVDMSRYNRSRFRFGFPGCVSDIRGLRFTNRLLRERALACVSREARFYANTDSFDNFARAFGTANAALVSHLKLQCFWPAKMLDEQEWPALHGMIREYLPNLEHLELWASHTGTPSPLPESRLEYAGISRQQQEICGLIKNAAFLRHPKLTRIIYTADSGPTFETGNNKITNRVVLENGQKARIWTITLRWRDATRTEPKVPVKDQVINATLVRKTRKSAMARLPLSDFVIQPSSNDHESTITTSELRTAFDIYEILHERAYKSRDEHAAKGWPWRGSDELIDFCEQLDELGVFNSADQTLVDALINSIDAHGIEKERLQHMTVERDRVDQERLGALDRLDQADQYLQRLEHEKEQLRDTIRVSADDHNELQEEYDMLKQDFENTKSELTFYKQEGISSLFEDAEIDHERMQERKTQKKQRWLKLN